MRFGPRFRVPGVPFFSRSAGTSLPFLSPAPGPPVRDEAQELFVARGRAWSLSYSNFLGNLVVVAIMVWICHVPTIFIF